MKVSDLSREDIKSVNFDNKYCTLGGDPEFFIAERKTKRIVSADKFFPSKHKPIRVEGREAINSKLFFDGIQAEAALAYNRCREYMVDNAQFVFEKVFSIIGKDHEVVIKPATRVQKSVIMAADPEARIFGCAPDFNAYTLSTNTSEMDASRHPFRYAGGHIHLGMSSPYLKEGDEEWELAMRPENHIRVIKLLDLILGITTLPLDNATGSKRRRDKYGKAGCFRPTPYGVEYRTQSCWWLKSPITLSLVYSLARIAWNVAINKKDKLFFKIAKVDEQEVNGTINNSDITNARKIWKNLRPYFAVIGETSYNPLNIRSAVSEEFEEVSKTNSIVGKARLPKFGKFERPVYSLALFEYMVKNGTEGIINPSPEIEWTKHSSPEDGTLTGGYRRVKENKDFFKFQSDFLKNVI